MGRLGGSGRTPIKQIASLTRRHVWQHGSMAEALRESRRQIWSSKTEKDSRLAQAIGNYPLDGNAVRLKHAEARAERLIEEAIALDPRLSRKSSWLRKDEGECVDSGLLAEGDDQPFYKRTRNQLNDATAAGQPVRVVISTDGPALDGTAAAFIATARIVAQFVPLEIWWQGAWLAEDKSGKGFVFLVLLVMNDADFSRLEFIINDPLRDAFSFRVMSSYAVHQAGESWNSCAGRAEYSQHEDGNAHFIPHTGIHPTAESVAERAARWLGWDTVSMAGWKEEAAASGAEQRVPALPAAPRAETEADRKAWAETMAKWNKESAEREKREARERLAALR
jgi:hypothetical protein